MKGLLSIFILGLGCLLAQCHPIEPSDNNIFTEEGSLLGSDLAKRTPAVEVSVWQGLGDGTKTHPTFVANLGTIFTTPTHRDIDEYAEKGYWSMMKQGPRQKDTHLMAALYIPQKKSIFLCSVPDSAAIRQLKDHGAADAPAWWSQVRNREPFVFHAEDGAAYRYEQTLNEKLAAGAQYPGGSYISVFGSVKNSKPEKVHLCSGGGDRPINPPCSTVFRNLNVEF